MNAIEMLKRQHREVEDLFEELDNAESPEGRFTVFTHIADALAIHAAIEEKHFYPSVNKRPTEDILFASVMEHIESKRLIADLLTLKGRDKDFDAKLKVLREDINRHVKEEERHLFPRVRKLFDQPTLSAVGEAMAAMQIELLRAGSACDTIPRQIVADATL